MIGTYWQVYAVCMAAALSTFWAGWACCLLANPGLPARHRRARRAAAEPGQLPAPLPDAPPLAVAALEARHGNVMARTAPHDIPPLVASWAPVAALQATIGGAAAAAYAATRAAHDSSDAYPWQDSTGTFPTVMLELEHQSAATVIPNRQET